jgi:hypothetical protein
MARTLFCLLLFVPLSLSAWAQQTDVNRYTVFTGFDYMVDPATNLTQRGFDVDFGVTAKRWLGLGADFSVMGNDILSGAGTITGSDTTFAPLLRSAAALGAPPPSAVHVPFKSTTYTFAAGGQIYIRKFEKITFLVRPGLGGIHQKVALALPPQLGALFTLLGTPVPSPRQSDTTWFIGVGTGFDLNLSRPVGLRFAADWVNTHLFSDLLTNRQNLVRVSIGPTFRWGHLK